MAYGAILGQTPTQFAKTITYTASASTSWQGSASTGYSQQINIAGILSTDNPIADVVLGTDIDANNLYLESWSMITRIVSNNGYIVLYANNEAPSTAFTFQLKVVR